MQSSTTPTDETTKENPPTASFTSSMAAKILWTPPFQDCTNGSDIHDGQPRSTAGNNTTAPNLPPTFTFPDGILSEVQATASYAFSRAVQMASVDSSVLNNGNDIRSTKSPPQPIISLYYPHYGCHNIIDSMVKSIAREQGADIVVLDSLELALEEFGAFGKETAHAIDMLFKPPANSDPPSTSDNDEGDLSDDTKALSHTIQKVFDDIVNIRQDANAPQGDSSAVEQTQSRIIYMRDFGGIALSAEALFPYLLQALHTRRTARFDKGSVDCERPVQPTVLILGFAETPKDNKDSDLGCDCFICRGRDEVPRSSSARGFSEGGAALRRILPSLGNKLSTIENVFSPSSSPFSTTFFLTALANPGEKKFASEIDRILGLERDEDSPAAESNSTPLNDCFSISIFPKDSHTSEFRKIEQRMSRERKHDIHSAWMTVCLRHRGAVVCENPLDSTEGGASTADMEQTANLLDVATLPNGLRDIPLPVVLDRIATIALGLSPQVSGSTAATQVTPTALSGAHKLFVENWKTRSDWLKAVKKNQKKDCDEDEKKTEETKSRDSEIVEKVKQAEDLSSYEKRLLSCIVDDSTITTTFEDVCIPGKIIDSLRTIISLPLLYPAAFKTGVLGKEAIGGVLLYGPPGTGKTLLCRALARESGARMLQVKPSDIMDLYVGESEKLAKSIFSLAYRLAPCIIFIDEMDALFRARGGKNDPQYFRNILNEFLQSMDGLQSAQKNKDAGVVVVGATNRPHDLDDAVLRRLATRMMVDLPGTKERQQILDLFLRNEKLDKDVNLSNIASQTPYYSGSDLKNLCVSAAMASVKDAVGDFNWTSKISPKYNADPTDQSETPALADGAESKIQTRTITLAHFMHAFNEVSASSSEGSHSELRLWHDRFGSKGSLANRNLVKSQTHRFDSKSGHEWGLKFMPGNPSRNAGNYGDNGDCTYGRK